MVRAVGDGVMSFEALARRRALAILIYTFSNGTVCSFFEFVPFLVICLNVNIGAGG